MRLKNFKIKIVALLRWIERKWREGAEIHNRQQTIINARSALHFDDERYTQNWYSIRGGL